MKITIQRHAVAIFVFTIVAIGFAVSPALAQDPSLAAIQERDNYAFSHNLNQETATFEAINPKSHAPGLMTVTISGVFRGNRLSDGQSVVGSHLKADQRAVFSFVPYDRYQPSFTGSINRWQLGGDTTDDSILFDFVVRTKGSDGSLQHFMLRQVVIVTEGGAQVAFGQLKLPDVLNTQAVLACGTVIDDNVAFEQQ